MVKRLLTLGAVAVMVLFLAGCEIFGDGNFVVGDGVTQASPGTYRSSGGQDCQWQRTGNFGGYVAGDFLSGPDVVTILPTDSGFSSLGCGLWARLPSTGPEVTSFGDGGYAIGIDIEPGTYYAPGWNGCYWEQDDNFLWNANSLVANGSPIGPVTVTLLPNAAAFKVQRCGTWTLVGFGPTGSNCFLNQQGNCYSAGESCPPGWQGLTVQGVNGALTCEDIHGVFLWESTPGHGSCLLSPQDTCYQAGEACPPDLQGLTVEGLYGPIICVDVGSDVFLWENTTGTVTNCFPNPEGGCYVAGETCPVSLAGQTVVGQDGLITCVQIGYLWVWQNAGSLTGCYLSPQDTCYQAGESCPLNLHGDTVEGAVGLITCIDIGSNVWVWENTV